MKTYKYDAFISYRHLEKDKIAASKLQQMLENFKPPRSLGMKKFKKWRIFRDETELPSSSNLSGDIKAALENSKFLIVVCTEETKNSRWCMEEIEYFKKLHNGSNSNIITLVADGEPSDVFPEELCNELYEDKDEDGNIVYKNRVIEPLAATISAKSNKQMTKKLKGEFLRIAAPLLECGYDDLYNRAQKRKIRRFVTIGALIAILMMSFGVYSSAMLLKINSQKEELLTANAELKLKTDELNKSNKDLTESYAKLEEKTKEAENNFKEAEKQKNKAEGNLKEANRQKAIAEENLKEANRQKALAEENLQEANRQKNIAEENLKEANRQKSIAEENEKEAVKQKGIAEENEKEAVKQKNKAEENEKEANLQKTIAEQNEKEANRQKTIAEANEEEANKQKTIAEENMQIAVENERKASEANAVLRKKNSEILASQAEIYYDNGDTDRAVKNAIEAMKSGENGEIEPNPIAEKVLISATNTYSSEEKYFRHKVSLRAPISGMEMSEDGQRILAYDNSGNIYLINTENNDVIKTWSVKDDFSGKYSSSYVYDMIVEGNTGYVLTNGYMLLSINLDSGDIRWRFDDQNYVSHVCPVKGRDTLLLYSYNSLEIINKSDGTLLYTNQDNEKFCYDYVYAEADGTIFSIDEKTGILHKYNPITGTYSNTDISEFEKVDVSAIYANDENVYVAYQDLTRTEYSKGTPTYVFCLDKKSLETKWKTDYYGNTVSNDKACLLDISFNRNNKEGRPEKVSLLVFSSGGGMHMFDLNTGKFIYEKKMDYNDYLIDCRRESYYLLMTYETGGIWAGIPMRDYDDKGNEIWEISKMGVGFPSFDAPMKYVKYGGIENTLLAVAPNNASEITIYRNLVSENVSEIPGFKKDYYSLQKAATGEGGYVALKYSCKEQGSDVYKNLIAVIDSGKNSVLGEYETTLDYPEIIFSRDKLFSVYRENYEIFDYKTGKVIKGNISEKIEKLISDAEKRYVSYYNPYLVNYGGKLLYINGAGVFALDISGADIDAKLLYDAGKLYLDPEKAVLVNDTLALEVNGYGEYGIAYMNFKEKKMEFIKDGEENLIFKSDVFEDVTASQVNNYLGYIDNEGIGITKIGSGNVIKISSASEGIVPEKLKFSPDGKTLVATCTGGKVVSYLAETGERMGECKLDVDFYDDDIEFIDNETFLIKRHVIDLYSMQEKLVFDVRFCAFLKENSKFLMSEYDENYDYILKIYDWLTPEELVKRAQAMYNL